LLPSNDAARKTYIVVRNRLVALPDGLMFLVPTKLIPTALTRLFGLRTKIRMGLELLHTSRPSGGDESVAALVRRHFGQEAVDRLADPLLSGIYGGDAEQLSAQTVLPRLVEMATKYGSLTRGMLAAHKRMRAIAKNSTGPKREAPPIFTALRGGMSQLVDALVAWLDPASLRTGTSVSAIRRAGGGWSVEVGGATETFEAVIMAAPAWAAGELLGPVDAALGGELGGIPYSSSITLNLIYDEKKIGQLPEGFGFLVPAVEGRAMLAESDEALVLTVRREMAAILGAKTISADVEPEHTQVSRWRRAMAQYAVGHKQRMQRIAARVAELPGLRLVGNAYDGIGVPDCIRLGRQAARELAAAGAKTTAAAR
jgi:oxygen-dependent protoporphyrinogen oxidase